MHTFKVSSVAVSKSRLRTISPKQAYERATMRRFEACSSYRGEVVETWGHPLFAAAHLAFAEHRPLVLSPDAIWLTIFQGFAAHVRRHSEELRSKFVAHEGKVEIVTRRDDFVKGSPENPWDEVVLDLARQARAHLLVDLDASFSTTGPIEKTATEVVLLSTVSDYMAFKVLTLCGIPEVTLEGAVEDWKRLAAAVAGLEKFGLSWWTRPLAQVTDELVRAASGQVSTDWWTSIYKERDESGGPKITGWLGWLVPYLEKSTFTAATGELTTRLERNPGVGTQGQFTHNEVPSPFASVPFKWKVLTTTHDYELLAGLTSVRADDLGVAPRAGWLVRPADAPQVDFKDLR